MVLENLQKTSRVRPPKLILYSKPGIGKTTFGASVPDHIFIDINDGLDDIPHTPYPIRPNDPVNPNLFKTYAELYQALQVIYMENHSFKALVIDGLSDVEQLIWKKLCQEWHVDSIEKVDKGYGKGYKYAMTYWNQILDGLTAIRDKKNMMVLLLAHADVKRYDDPMNDSYDRYILKVHEQAGKKLHEWADAVMFADQKILVSKVDQGFNKKKNKAIGASHVIYTREKPSHVAKNRYGLPDEIPLNYDKFIEAFNNSSTRNYIVEQAQIQQTEEAAPWDGKNASDSIQPVTQGTN